MKKRNQPLNKIERMLLESRFPTLRILLEDEEKKEEKPADEKPKEDAGSDKKEEGGDDGGGGLAALFGDDSGGEEKDAAGDEGKEGDDDPLAGGEDAPADAEEPAEAKPDKKAEEEAKEKAAKAAADQAAQVFQNVVGLAGMDTHTSNEFNDKLFGNTNPSSNVKSEGSYRNRQMKKLRENISRYLFRNVKMSAIKNKKVMSLHNNFEMNEKKMLKINRVINEAESVDDMINNKFWEDNAAVDLIVDNAINLTKNFENLMDIPALIMNSVAIKFGRQAAEESTENKGAENEYKLKLEEFLDKYSRALTQLADYENYDVSKYRFDMSNPDKQAVGAFNPGG